MPTLLVIGAQGVLGGLAADVCRNAGWTVLRGGRRAEVAPDFRLVDLDRPETLAAACAEADVVLNAVEDPLCRAERHVLEAGGTILNMATIQVRDRERLKAAVAAPKGRAIFGAGYTGVAAIVAKELLDRHADADRVDSAYTMSLKGMSGRAGALFGHRLLSGGRRRATREIDFGGPLGRRACLEVNGRDEGFIDPSVVGERAAPVYLTLVEKNAFRVFLGLDRLGLLARLPASWIRPQPPKSARIEAASTETMMTWLGASRNGQLLGARTIAARGDYLTTARIA
ncbi:MAG TPA: hypothetical protein VJM11_14075, partial [Nevskiaceae bacterium]|nr:hypothetical protein [Nevskiaceae bacterium]